MKIIKKNDGLIEELAELRHNQLRAWTRNLFAKLNEFKYEGKSLDDFGAEMMTLCKYNWEDYKKLSEDQKKVDRLFAFAVVDIVKKHSNK